MPKEGVVRPCAKAALSPWTDVGLSEKAAEAAVRVASLVPEVRTTDRLWSPSDRVSLYHRIFRDVLSFPESL